MGNNKAKLQAYSFEILNYLQGGNMYAHIQSIKILIVFILHMLHKKTLKNINKSHFENLYAKKV